MNETRATDFPYNAFGSLSKGDKSKYNPHYTFGNYPVWNNTIHV